MKVKCKYTSYRDVVPTLDPEEYAYFYGIHLEHHKEYIVYGIATMKNGKIEYLIQDETFYPSFYVADLFDITDPVLPYEEWCFRNQFVTESNFASCLCYKEFLFLDNHFDGVLLHDDRHIARFEEWRASIDQQYRQS